MLTGGFTVNTCNKLIFDRVVYPGSVPFSSLFMADVFIWIPATE
jgi:hypothetical protein